MEFFKVNTKIQFMRQRRWAAVFSAIIFIASLIALATQGLTLGLDFTGGTQIEASFPQAPNIDQIRVNLVAKGFKQAVVQRYPGNEVLIRVGPHKEWTPEQLQNNLIEALPAAKIGGLDYIGPEVSKTLLTNGVLAVLVALISTMAYITFRFEYRFALSAAVALIHDPILILGIFAFFHLNLT